jgi:hypothetical protein
VFEFIPTSGDNAPALQDALNNHLGVTVKGWCQLNSQVHLGYGMALDCYGNNTSFRKGFDGDLFLLGTNAQLRNFYVDTIDPSLTGGAFKIEPGTTEQRISNIMGGARDFFIKWDNKNDGAGLIVRDCNFLTMDTSKFGVQASPEKDDMGTGIRSFYDIRFAGGKGFDFGGAANTMVDRCNMTDIKFPAQSQGGFIRNSRIATLAPIEVRGTYWTLFANVNQHPWHLMPELNNSDIWQYLGAGAVDMGAGPYVRVHT